MTSRGTLFVKGVGLALGAGLVFLATRAQWLSEEHTPLLTWGAPTLVLLVLLIQALRGRTRE